MPVVFIDEIEVSLGDKERLNGIQAARRAGVDIPHYCWHAGLSVVASCRMCLVEVGHKDAASGKITMQPKLVPACQTPAKDGTVFITASDKVRQARAMVEEDLLLRHPVDCPICDKAGECSLQDYHFEYGQKERRADIQPFTSRRRDLGPTVTLFVDRCVMCTRCVRFTREVSGTSELMVTHRGAHEEIDVFRDEEGKIVFPLANKLSGNVVDLCPVGALGDKDFLYRQRVWFMNNREHLCGNCSTGCSIWVDETQDRIHRVRPRENPHVNQWWMCDEGRYGWHHVHDDRRLTEPRRKQVGGYATLEWSALAAEIDKQLRAAGRLGAVLSPHLTMEEAYLLATYIRQIDPQAVLAMGPVPVEGKDERYPGGFVIHAEKCPNRRGVEPIVARLGGSFLSWGDFLGRLARERFGAVWVSGGYYQPWNDAATCEKFAGVGCLIVQDCFTSPLLEQADYQLPGGTYPERAGSFVNFNDRLQSFDWAIRPPQGVQVEGQLYWQLLRRPGLYDPRAVLEELGREISYFAPAIGEMPEVGVDLKANQLAYLGPP
jgi:NADH-quinone oxidoreductase subunit G